AAVCSAKEPSRMSTEERIIRLLNITSGYYKVAAPPPDNGTANVIKFRTKLIRISSVDVVNQLVSLDLWIMMFWTDLRLAWNETDDPKLAKFEKIFLPTDYVWLPDLSLSHPVDVKSFETNKFLVDVSSNGRMKLETPLGITIKCPLKMRDFPFDTQVCQFSFSSAAKKQTLLQLEIKSGLPINYSEINLQNNEYCVTSVRSVIIDFSTQFPQFKKLLVTVEFE
uniref:Neur_chan_LBD domain-containing protein n=1 Tax=Macrostomum lignano TaxID=282301 RepID=A0A1I8GNC0_9PLAT